MIVLNCCIIDCQKKVIDTIKNICNQIARRRYHSDYL